MTFSPRTTITCKRTTTLQDYVSRAKIGFGLIALESAQKTLGDDEIQLNLDRKGRRAFFIGPDKFAVEIIVRPSFFTFQKETEAGVETLANVQLFEDSTYGELAESVVAEVRKHFA